MNTVVSSADQRAGELRLAGTAASMGCGRDGDALNVRHYTCADLKPPNVFPGSDALVTTPSKRSKNFDALSPKNELWEVKTGSDAGGDFSANSEFVQQVQLRQDTAEIRHEKSIADECGLPFIFAVSDPLRLSALKQRFNDVSFKLVDC